MLGRRERGGGAAQQISSARWKTLRCDVDSSSCAQHFSHFNKNTEALAEGEKEERRRAEEPSHLSPLSSEGVVPPRPRATSPPSEVEEEEEEEE